MCSFYFSILRTNPNIKIASSFILLFPVSLTDIIINVSVLFFSHELNKCFLLTVSVESWIALRELYYTLCKKRTL